MYLKDVKVGEGFAEYINPDADMEMDAQVTVSGLKAGESVNFYVKVSVVDHESEDVNDDNEGYITLNVTEDVLAYDLVEESMCTDENRMIGSSSLISFGIPVRVTCRDTLTGISMMWAAGDSYETEVGIYKMDAETGTLGDLVYTGSYRKSKSAGEQVFETPAIVLDGGWYFIFAQSYGYVLVMDFSENGFYEIVNNGLVAVNGFGMPGLRARFAQGKQVLNKDALISSIDKPSNNSGFFGANQTIAATVCNYGIESVSGKVTLKIDDTEVESTEVVLERYGRTQVQFKGDLSAEGKHTILFSVECEGDENPDNNELSKTITTRVPDMNPYIMNFEYCEDFSTDGFIPAWTTYDGDGAITYGFADYEFPGMNEPFAFMAFNPAEVSSDFIPDYQAYEGDRFGASFVAYNTQNDDWLISPKLTLPLENAEMTLMVKTFAKNPGLESYEILYSPTENIEDFEVLKQGVAPVEDWEKVTVDLSAFGGKSIYLAVRCVSEGQFIFMVDDIRISQPTSNIDPVAACLRLYPNPVEKMLTITSGSGNIRSVAIFNVCGREIYSGQRDFGGSFRYDVSSLNSGIYFARVTTPQGSAVLKFIVK